MKTLSFFSRFLLLLISFSFLGCFEKDHPSESNEKTAVLQLGHTSIHVELALTSPEQTRGLMGRTSLPENGGMLFVFDKPDSRSFWMKNTVIPLDIGYFDATGTLLEIYPLFPNNLTSVKSRSNAILYALEMNQDWFEKNKIYPGAKLDTEKLNKLIEARKQK